MCRQESGTDAQGCLKWSTVTVSDGQEEDARRYDRRVLGSRVSDHRVGEGEGQWHDQGADFPLAVPRQPWSAAPHHSQDGKECVVKEVVPGDSVNSLLSILDVITVSDQLVWGAGRLGSRTYPVGWVGEVTWRAPIPDRSLRLWVVCREGLEGAMGKLQPLPLILPIPPPPRVTSTPSGPCLPGLPATPQCCGCRWRPSPPSSPSTPRAWCAWCRSAAFDLLPPTPGGAGTPQPAGAQAVLICPNSRLGPP